MDMISSLPDHIICHILSFLPTKYAFQSSILSTRWKDLWASVPILDFDARQHRDFNQVINMNANPETDVKFQNFVSKVIIFNDMPYIRRFRLNYECRYRSAPIRTWLHVAISRHIEELELDLSLSVQCEIIELPRWFFASSMLVILKLSRMHLNVPSSVCFPSLKILELRRIIYLHDKCIENLLSGCQILEELVIEETAREKPKVVLISIPTLRSFCFSYKFVIDLFVDPPYKFIINTPKLEFFHVKGRISDVFEVRSLASLSYAHVDLGLTALSTENYNICHKRIFDLFELMTNAESLTLSREVVQLLCEASDRSLPRFPNLKQLAFGIGLDFGWKKLLMEFIKCSSYLESFTLNNKQGFLRDMDERQTPLQPLPDNMFSYLKSILIDELYAKFMPEYIECMVRHVNVLKMLKINCRCPIALRSQIGLTF